jgi:hypothetical protein
MLSSTHTFLYTETSFVNMADTLEEVFTRPTFSSFQDRLGVTPDATLVCEHEEFEEFLVSKLSRASVMTSSSLLVTNSPVFTYVMEQEGE